MSTVYLAYDRSALQPVAVKVLAEPFSSQRPAVSRFDREARLSRILDHPYLVRGLAHGCDPDAGKHFLVLEFVDGPNALAVLQQAGPFSPAAVVQLGVEVGRALYYLHGKDYLHCDVKPENLLIGPNGTAKLGDLGLARRMAGGAAQLPAGVGTPHYMPYEQATGVGRVAARSDVFALGATLYHLITGRLPFAGDRPEDLTREKGLDAFLPPRAVRPDVPPELDRVIGRCLRRDPEQRFQTAIELVVALQGCDLRPAPYELADLPAGEGTPVPVGRTALDPDVPTLPGADEDPDDPVMATRPDESVRPAAPSAPASSVADRVLTWCTAALAVASTAFGVAGVLAAVGAGPAGETPEAPPVPALFAVVADAAVGNP